MIRFSNLQISKKNYSKSQSWAWNLNKLFTVMGRNLKFRIVIWSNFFWKFGDMKNESHFLKNSHLYRKHFFKQYERYQSQYTFVNPLKIDGILFIDTGFDKKYMTYGSILVNFQFQNWLAIFWPLWRIFVNVLVLKSTYINFPWKQSDSDSLLKDD